MYEAFTKLLTFAEKLGEITEISFHAEAGPYHGKGADISGVSPSGDVFAVSMDFKGAPSDA